MNKKEKKSVNRIKTKKVVKKQTKQKTSSNIKTSTENNTEKNKHIEKILKDNKPSGGRLNFLLQEIGREINTIGSKSISSKIVNNIVYMKDEAEKIREQIQNIL